MFYVSFSHCLVSDTRFFSTKERTNERVLMYLLEYYTVWMCMTAKRMYVYAFASRVYVLTRRIKEETKIQFYCFEYVAMPCVSNEIRNQWRCVRLLYHIVSVDDCFPHSIDFSFCCFLYSKYSECLYVVFHFILFCFMRWVQFERDWKDKSVLNRISV